MIFEIAHQLGILPLFWLVALVIAGQDHRAAWWWMAGGFGVSWLADTASHWAGHQFVSQLYPVTQAAIFVLVLAPRKYIEGIVGLLLATASISLAARHAQGLDVLLHVVAWGTVAALGWHLWRLGGWLRWSLGVAFGLGAVAWCAYVVDPGWWTWGSYQMTRLVGTGLWCVAVWKSGE